jgi:hypothetical protein
MSIARQPPRPPVVRPARLALRIPDAGASGIIDATDLRAEPLVPTLAASLASSRCAPPPLQPRPRPDAWPLAVLSTLLAVVVAFTGVAAAARFVPGMATHRGRVTDGHLSMRSGLDEPESTRRP